MPAIRLSDNPVSVNTFDVLVLGNDDLMFHAMLCAETIARSDVTARIALRTTHMGPPLGLKRFQCNAVGSAELNEDDRRKIRTYVDERNQENEAERSRYRLLRMRWDARTQYQIHPPSSPPTKDYPLWRFSCVGYVLEAYRTARIDLLGNELPKKSIDDLKQLYPDQANDLDNVDKQKEMGIGEGNQWPIALVGYLLHSLARELNLIRGSDSQPYQANEGDEFFPRRIAAPANQEAGVSPSEIA